MASKTCKRVARVIAIVRNFAVRVGVTGQRESGRDGRELDVMYPGWWNVGPNPVALDLPPI